MAGEWRNSGFVLCSKCPGLFQNSIVAGEWQNSGFVTCKGGLMSESGGEFSNPPKWVPKTYLVLFNAVQWVDKMGKTHLFVVNVLHYFGRYANELGHRLRTPGEEIDFTTWPKIKSQS